MSKNLERFTNGYGHSVTSWALQMRTWFLLKNMPKPLRASANHLLRPALFLAVPSTSSESIALFGESPVSKAYNPSHWWISGCKKTAQPLRQSGADLRAVTFDHPCTARVVLSHSPYSRRLFRNSDLMTPLTRGKTDEESENSARTKDPRLRRRTGCARREATV